MDKKRLATIFDKTKIEYPQLTVGSFRIKVFNSRYSDIRSETIKYINSYLMYGTSTPEDSFDKFLKWFKDTYVEIKFDEIKFNKSPEKKFKKFKKYPKNKSNNYWKKTTPKSGTKKRTVTDRDRYFQKNYLKSNRMLGLSFQCPSCHRMLVQTKICSRCN